MAITGSSESVVLLVRHGPGRGRLQAFGDGWLRRLARTRPELRGRIEVHETGSQRLPQLARVACVVFLLADPVRELYPACYAEASAIAEKAKQRGIRLVNAPDALSNTIKSVQARLWAHAGVPCAPCQPFESREALERLANSATFPVIVRGDLLHAQQSTFVCRSPDEVRALPKDQVAYPGQMVRFIDSRTSYLSAPLDSVFARYYHRCRTYVFGRHVVPGAIYFSASPIVGSDTATWARYAGNGRFAEPLAWIRREDRQIVAADMAFANSSPLHPQLMRQAANVLGLEFAGLDHVVLADGSVVFWEANPHFYIAPFRDTPLPIARHIWPRTRRIHDAIGMFLAELLDPRSGRDELGGSEAVTLTGAGGRTAGIRGTGGPPVRDREPIT